MNVLENPLQEQALEKLIQKYNVSAPRYTSYPTVPFWDQQAPTTEQWFQVVEKAFTESNATKGISLYLHLPFCESLCTYCGCNTRITKNHGVELGYIETLLAEWKQYVSRFSEKPIIRELHLGGGTPTFFSPENLRILLEGIYASAEIHPEREFSFEGHPNNTTTEHLQTLYDLGFRRVSYGIQDFDPLVQLTINRIQPFEKVQRATEEARSIGYESVNFDLIYGLPHQTPASVEDTINQVALLRPDRIAFYSYAHVPWVKPSQRGYSEKDLPAGPSKRALYELGLQMFRDLGYHDIGMDHFALPQDALFLAQQNGTLHRNFMGYTTCHTDLLIGLGVSSISDAKYGYLQNLKKVEEYKAGIASGNLAILKGHLLTQEDLIRKEAILDLACKGKLQLTSENLFMLDDPTIANLWQMEKEGLLSMKESVIRISALGQAFLRNICMLFDQKVKQTEQEFSSTFSKAI
ncbi:oxygen-independent coproporphyrinogen III oxidase [Rufibacter hautae]|uniref:Coproporphyrinogen-III oxidase n=1 Tax=Rufibacter hautae TaxID=2595005 RepID=A0A5B6TM08_9BACT|nr:oxygen-independent coproporphyrinogen III oxidase [Rufibacter hautae]KAA3437132.1 oxygen-independent coproporphyrinogen III oxidase [Rufibacter hautae]